MAITGIDNDNTTQQQQVPQQEFKRGSFLGGGLFGAAISKGIGSEGLNKLAEKLTDKFKGVIPELSVKVHVIDQASEPALAYSVIVIASYIKSKPSYVTAHTLIIEATGERLTDVTENINGTNVEVMRVTSNAYDRKMASIIKGRLSKAYPNASVDMIDACVVPTEFDVESITAVHQLALNASLACTTELEVRQPGFRDFSIQDELRGVNMVVHIQRTNGSLEDSMGMPIRSDAVITLRSQKPNQQQENTLNSNDRDMSIASLSCFVDMMYNPIVSPVNQWLPHQQQMPQKFSPRLVMTNLRTEIGYTPAMVLLSLISASAMNNDMHWAQLFYQVDTGRRKGNDNRDIDIRDIGALNIEGNIQNEKEGFGTPPDTKNRDFSIQDLGRFIMTLIHQGLTFSIDVPDGGPTTWYTSVFREASNGKQGAIDIIYTAFNELTGGRFGQHFPLGTDMFVDRFNRIHLGYWTDKNEQRCDIRDIDYLAVANILGRKDPHVLKTWTDTFFNQSIPLPIRLEQRRTIINVCTNHKAVFTDFATRVTFSSAFIIAGIKACMEVGFNPTIKTPMLSADFHDVRGVADFANASALATNMQFGHAGFGYGPNVNQNRYNMNTRW